VLLSAGLLRNPISPSLRSRGPQEGAAVLLRSAARGGCFLCLIRKNVGHLIGYQVTLSFSLYQHARDLDLMLKIKEYLGFGIISQGSPSGEVSCGETTVPGVVRLTVTKKSDINTLISFFENYMLIGSKRLNLEDFSKIQVMINNNLHKTEAGLNKIRLIKDGMNKNRKDGNEKI